MLHRCAALAAALVLLSAPSGGAVSADWPKKGNCPDGSKIDYKTYTEEYQCFNNGQCKQIDPDMCCVWYSYAFCGYPGTNHGGSEETQCNAYNACMTPAQETTPAPASGASTASEEDAAAAATDFAKRLKDCQADVASEEAFEEKCAIDLAADGGAENGTGAPTSAPSGGNAGGGASGAALILSALAGVGALLGAVSN